MTEVCQFLRLLIVKGLILTFPGQHSGFLVQFLKGPETGPAERITAFRGKQIPESCL